jgi:predicted lactoylglutathione lyase
MKPLISVITLGVNDLEKSLAFYRDGLGWPSKGIVATEFHDEISGAAGAIALFELQNGLLLSLYPRTELAKDAKQEMSVKSPTEFSLGYLANSKEEVDALLKQAKVAGAAITGEPRHRPWGIYSGYFQDLDGHLWEIIWNP